MGVHESIFEAFFRKLEQDETLPDSIAVGLKDMVERGRPISQESILELIRRVYEDVSEDQED